MTSKHILLIALAAISVSACKKEGNPAPRPDTGQAIQVLGYSQNVESAYENHYLWTTNEVKSYARLNLNVNHPLEYGVIDGNDIYIAQNGSFWKNSVKTDLFQLGGVTANVTYKYNDHTLSILVRKAAQDPAGLFDYSIMEGGNTLFTIAGNGQNKYEFKDFLKLGSTYYLLGYLTATNTQPIIYIKKATETSVIVLNTAQGVNFQPFRFTAAASRFYALGYINRNGVLNAAVLSLNMDGSDKSITELNVPANTVLYDLLVDGPDIYATGWEPKDNSGSYYAFYLKNNQKIPLSNKQSRAMQLLKYKNDVYVAGLEWEPALTYKLWKNGEQYAILETAAHKPIVPLQLFAK